MARRDDTEDIESLIADGDFEEARGRLQRRLEKFDIKKNGEWVLINADVIQQRYADCERRVEERRRGVLGIGGPEPDGKQPKPERGPTKSQQEQADRIERLVELLKDPDWAKLQRETQAGELGVSLSTINEYLATLKRR